MDFIADKNGKVREMTEAEADALRHRLNDTQNRRTLGKAVRAYVSSEVTPKEVVEALQKRGLPANTDV